MAEVRKEPDQAFNIGGGWHTDHSYDQIPALGSLLYAKEVPTTGGDTLSEGIKDTLRSLRGVHSSRHVFGQSAPLLQFLYGHIARPEHTCRFRWQPDSLAFWDNRPT